jgi:hypothetical protein
VAGTAVSVAVLMTVFVAVLVVAKPVAGREVGCAWLPRAHAAMGARLAWTLNREGFMDSALPLWRARLSSRIICRIWPAVISSSAAPDLDEYPWFHHVSAACTVTVSIPSGLGSWFLPPSLASINCQGDAGFCRVLEEGIGSQRTGPIHDQERRPCAMQELR